jgi:hypothetical protein
MLKQLCCKLQFSARIKGKAFLSSDYVQKDMDILTLTSVAADQSIEMAKHL